MSCCVHCCAARAQLGGLADFEAGGAALLPPRTAAHNPPGCTCSSVQAMPTCCTLKCVYSVTCRKYMCVCAAPGPHPCQEVLRAQLYCTCTAVLFGVWLCARHPRCCKLNCVYLQQSMGVYAALGPYPCQEVLCAQLHCTCTALAVFTTSQVVPKLWQQYMRFLCVFLYFAGHAHVLQTEMCLQCHLQQVCVCVYVALGPYPCQEVQRAQLHYTCTALGCS